MSTLIFSNVDIALRHVSAPSLHVNMLYVSCQHANTVMSTCNTGDVNAPNMHVGLVKTVGFLLRGGERARSLPPAVSAPPLCSHNVPLVFYAFYG